MKRILLGIALALFTIQPCFAADLYDDDSRYRHSRDRYEREHPDPFPPPPRPWVGLNIGWAGVYVGNRGLAFGDGLYYRPGAGANIGPLGVALFP